MERHLERDKIKNIFYYTPTPIFSLQVNLLVENYENIGVGVQIYKIKIQKENP
jgi:hypothetical protein